MPTDFDPEALTASFLRTLLGDLGTELLVEGSTDFLRDAFAMVMLLSSATGLFRCLHHPKPAKSHGRYRLQFSTIGRA